MWRKDGKKAREQRTHDKGREWKQASEKMWVGRWNIKTKRKIRTWWYNFLPDMYGQHLGWLDDGKWWSDIHTSHHIMALSVISLKMIFSCYRCWWVSEMAEGRIPAWAEVKLVTRIELGRKEVDFRSGIMRKIAGKNKKYLKSGCVALN